LQFLTVGVQQTYYATKRASINDTQYLSTGFRTRPIDLSDIAVSVKVTPQSALDSTTRLEYDVHGAGLHVHHHRDNRPRRCEYHDAQLQPLQALDGADRETGKFAFRGNSSLNMLQGRARGAYSLTWDIGRSAILNQSIGLSYLGQCLWKSRRSFRNSSSRRQAPPFPSRRTSGLTFRSCSRDSAPFSNFFGAFGGLFGSTY
jgi:hypothetical protein